MRRSFGVDAYHNYVCSIDSKIITQCFARNTYGGNSMSKDIVVLLCKDSVVGVYSTNMWELSLLFIALSVCHFDNH